MIAALLMLVLAFGAGAAADRSGLLGGRGGAGGRVPPVAVVPTASPVPQTVSPSGTAGSSPSVPASPSAPGEPTPAASPTSAASPTPVVGTIGPGVTMPPSAPANFGLFWQALQLLREHYVDQSALDPRQLTYGAIRGMLESLDDPGHTDFMTPEERKAQEESLNGKVTGIGVMLGRENDVPTIVAVIPGGPADRAGVRAGDVFFRIDGRPVAGLDDQAISSLVRGPLGSTVVIEVTRGGSPAPLRFELIREQITVPAVTWAPVPGTDVAHVFVANFSEGASEQVKEALAQALDGRRAVILDLRQNPGGFVHEAVRIASQFLADGTVYIKQKGSGEREPVAVEPGGVATQVEMVVLVDAGSASSAEIVAGALQDADRAPLIGTKTFGTGTVVLTYGLDDGSAVRIGVEQWLTPEGRQIWREGIEPDEVVELAPGTRVVRPQDLDELTLEQLLASPDTQLVRALERLGVRR
jgi:carboxyl-terminal processing protease